MKFVRAQVAIRMDSGLPADDVTNTFHFTTDSATVLLGAPEIHAALTAFYQSIDNTIFGAVIGGQAHVKYYDLQDASPRVPHYEADIALTAAAGDPLPSQCAIVLSFQAPKISGVVQARRRGRVFLGPLSINTIGTTDGYARPTAAVRDVIRDAALILADTTADAGNNWCVYSPTTDASETIADAFFAVENGWVDNRYDTQRKRLPDATARDTFVLV